MSHKLINLSPDLKKLRDFGLATEIKCGHILVHDIPYVNSARVVKTGTLVSELTLSGTRTAKPGTHVAHFIGEHPCNKDGSLISQIQHSSGNSDLGQGLVINHTFSNKPADGYTDYFEKITTYINIISSPAKALGDYSEITYRPFRSDDAESVFNYVDTNSSRAQINTISAKLEEQTLVIVGLGGTGSYILDLVSKAPVKEIRLFDGDDFLLHNAFRTPGAATIEKLDERPKKTDYLKSIYSAMHKHIVSNPMYLDGTNLDKITDANFVFLCMDKGEQKRAIVDVLLAHNISFIDVGMGIEIVEGSNTLIGIARITLSTAGKRDHIATRIPFGNQGNDLYAQNIQIAELNALTATLAVIKWKKLCGFYQDLENEHNTTYSINTGQLLNDEIKQINT